MMHIMRPWKRSRKKRQKFKRLKEEYEKNMKSIREEMNQQFTQILSIIQQNPQLAFIKPEALTHKK